MNEFRRSQTSDVCLDTILGDSNPQKQAVSTIIFFYSPLKLKFSSCRFSLFICKVLT
jgi:hypothetical protein